MEESLKFNSKVCTNLEQSKRLLDLGLNPETADCMWCAVTKDAKGKEIPSKNIKWYLQAHTSTYKQIVGFMEYTHIPAWSLHRLIELYSDVEDTSSLCIKNISYKLLIFCIEKAIHCGYFNKEYLKQ